MKKQIPLFLILCCLFACAEDPRTADLKPTHYKIVDLFSDEIDDLVSKLEAVALPGHYEYVEGLIYHCGNAVLEIQKTAGRSLETVTGQNFGFETMNVKARQEALAKAKSWWASHKKKLLQETAVKFYKPYLEKKFVNVGTMDYENYILRKQFPLILKNAALGIYTLRGFGKDVWPLLHDILDDRRSSQLLKEKVAFILEGQEDATLKDHMQIIIHRADQKRLEKICAFYRIWGKLDPLAAAKHLRGRINKAKGIEYQAYLKTYYGIDANGLAEFFKAGLNSSDPQIRLLSVVGIGEFGYSELRKDILETVLLYPETDMRQAYARAVRRLGLRLALRDIFEKIDQASGNERLICLEMLIFFKSEIEEIDKMRLLNKVGVDKRSPDAQAVRMGALLLREKGSKSAVLKLIKLMKEPVEQADVLETLKRLTGHDFSVVDAQAFDLYKQNEMNRSQLAGVAKPTDSQLKQRYLHNRAMLWWVDNRDLTQIDWLLEALNEAGFHKIKTDKHFVSTWEQHLCRKLFDLSYINMNDILKTLLDSGDQSNIIFALNEIKKRALPDTVELLRERVDRPGHKELYGTYGQYFCSIATMEYHLFVKALLRSQQPKVVQAAENYLIRTNGFGEIKSLISDVENASEENATRANNLLRTISRNDFGNINHITKPQREKVVKRWKRWWRAVHDNSYSGSWQKIEVKKLLESLSMNKEATEIWLRLQQLTHIDSSQQNVENFKQTWEKHKSHWGQNGRYIVDLVSENWFRVERAQSVLLAQATHSDVAHMIDLLDAENIRLNDRILPVVRILTGKNLGYTSSLSLTDRKRKCAAWKLARDIEAFKPVLNHETLE